MTLRGRRGWILGTSLLATGTLVWALGHWRQSTRWRLRRNPGPVTEVRDVAYLPGSPHPKHRLDLYMPEGARGVPVVLFIHGGYWVEGDRNYFAFASGLYGSVGRALAREGIGCVITSYRLSPETGIEGMLDDVLAALRWTQENAAAHGGDPARIFVMGHSAGGHLAALLACDESLHRGRGLDPKSVRGYLPLSAVWDLADMRDRHDDAFNSRVTYAVFGRDEARLKRYSPIHLLHPGMPPVLIGIGGRDFGYMIPQAEEARRRLERAGVQARVLRLDGYDHYDMVLGFGAKDDQITEPVTEFVRGLR